MRITIVGAGNVGTTCANIIAQKELAHEVLLLDIKEGVAEGKSLDIWQSAPILGHNSQSIGVTNDYERTECSKIVVITSGIARKPGMSRDDLIFTNAKIVKSVTENILKYSPDAKIIVVSNPLDIMTYTAYLSAKIDPSKVFGMSGILDTARYKAFIAAELNVSPSDIQALILGGHGDTMVPLIRYTTVSGIPIDQLLSKEKLEEIIKRTQHGGGELVSLMGTSAWHAPGAAAAQMVESVALNHKRLLPVSAYLQGQYGLEDIYLGVPVILGRNGVEKIIEIKLTDEEMALFRKSANAIEESLNVLNKMELFEA